MLEDGAGLFSREGVVDVAELDGGEDLFRIELGEESPKGLFFGARVEIPNRVDQSAGREVNDALLRAKPAELAVVGQLAAEGSHVCGERLKRSAFDETREVLKGQDTQLVSTAQGEGQAIAFKSIVRLEDAVGG